MMHYFLICFAYSVDHVSKFRTDALAILRSCLRAIKNLFELFVLCGKFSTNRIKKCFLRRWKLKKKSRSAEIVLFSKSEHFYRQNMLRSAIVSWVHFPSNARLNKMAVQVQQKQCFFYLQKAWVNLIRRFLLIQKVKKFMRKRYLTFRNKLCLRWIVGHRAMKLQLVPLEESVAASHLKVLRIIYFHKVVHALHLRKKFRGACGITFRFLQNRSKRALFLRWLLRVAVYTQQEQAHVGLQSTLCMNRLKMHFFVWAKMSKLHCVFLPTLVGRVQLRMQKSIFRIWHSTLFKKRSLLSRLLHFLGKKRLYFKNWLAEMRIQKKSQKWTSNRNATIIRNAFCAWTDFLRTSVLRNRSLLAFLKTVCKFHAKEAFSSWKSFVFCAKIHSKLCYLRNTHRIHFAFGFWRSILARKIVLRNLACTQVYRSKMLMTRQILTALQCKRVEQIKVKYMQMLRLKHALLQSWKIWRNCNDYALILRRMDLLFIKTKHIIEKKRYFRMWKSNSLKRIAAFSRFVLAERNRLMQSAHNMLVH